MSLSRQQAHVLVWVDQVELFLNNTFEGFFIRCVQVCVETFIDFIG